MNETPKQEELRSKETRDRQDSLKFLSQTYRSLHEQRRKIEIQVVLAAMTFYVLAAGSRFSDKVKFPTGCPFSFIVWIAFIGLAVVTSAFLLGLHRANSCNMRISEQAEDELMKMLGWTLPAANHSKASSPHLGWRWQTMIVLIFSAACASIVAPL